MVSMESVLVIDEEGGSLHTLALILKRSGFVATSASMVTYQNNISRDNVQNGFAFFETAKGAVNDYECYRNAFCGISLNGSAAPQLGSNNFEVKDKKELSFFIPKRGWQNCQPLFHSVILAFS